MKRSVSIASGIVSVSLVAFAAWRGADVPFKEQWPLYEGLRTTAAIIFAVVGAWLAIIYPERLRVSFLVGAKPTQQAVGTRFGDLFAPIVNSSAILCAVLLIGVAAPIVQRIGLASAHSTFLRGFSYAVLVALTLWQLWTIVLSLIPADIVKSRADADRRRNEIIGARMHMGSTVVHHHEAAE